MCLLAVTAKTRLIDLSTLPNAEHLNIHVNHQPSSMCVCALPMCHLIIRPQMCGGAACRHDHFQSHYRVTYLICKQRGATDEMEISKSGSIC